MTLAWTQGLVTFQTGTGTHTLVCDGPEGTATRVFTINGPDGPPVSCIPDSDSSRTIAWTLVVSGSVLFAGGVTFLAWHFADESTAQSINDSLRAEALADGRPLDEVDLVVAEPVIPHRDILGPALMGAGLATGLFSLLFFNASDEPTTSAHLRPLWRPSDGGGLLGVSGRF